jgi:hypothetical protein
VSVKIWDWLAAMRRRWLVLVVGLLCTVCVVWMVHKRPVSYQACGSVILSAPTTPTNPNGYNNAQASLIAATGLITLELQSPTVKQQLRADGATAEYKAEMHNTGTVETPAYWEPEMDVCASARDPETPVRTTDAVLTEFGSLLRAREVGAHVAPRYFLTDSVLASPGSVPELDRPSQAYLGVGVLGLIATATSALWIDRYLLRRTRRSRDEYATRAAAAPASYARHFD